MTPETAPEMSLFTPDGRRLYLTAKERAAFLAAAADEEAASRMFCQMLHYTGCRPTEALELTPERIMLDDGVIVIRSLKKRKVDFKGRIKAPKFRMVPVPAIFLDHLDLVFGIGQIRKQGKGLDSPLWPVSRPTAYRLIKRVMDRAGIVGPQATGKGLRHGFGVAMVTAAQPVPIHVLADLMGHSDSKTTEIYLQVVGEEKQQLVTAAWGE